MKFVCTWMYSTPPGDKVLHSQVGYDSDSAEIQNYYWRCVFCLFESSHRLNRDTRHILFANKLPPAAIDGVDIPRCMSAFEIELVQLDKWSRPPAGYYKEWNTQFITLDVLDWLAGRVGDDDVVLVLDSDCVFHRAIGEDLEAAVRENGALLYTLDYPPDQEINGLTSRALRSLGEEYDPRLDLSSGFVYNGGEFICAAGKEIRRIAPLARTTYETSIDRHARGQAKFHEEAHLLSFVYHALGYATRTGNRFIKRIWTDRSLYQNVDESEDALTIWHLPAEKRRGFVRVFRGITQIDGDVRVSVKDFATAFGLKENVERKIERYVKTVARPVYRAWKRHKTRAK